MDSDPEPLSLDFSKTPKNSQLIACIGWNRSFGGYLASYEQAVECLFKSIDRGREPIDLIAVSGQSKPASKGRMKTSHFEGSIAYWAAWAALERNERTLWELHQMNGEPYNDPKVYKNHRLDQLHEALQAQHKKAVEKYDLPESEVENFGEYCKKTEAGLKQFIALDAGSFNFRYPIDNVGGGLKMG